MNKETGKRIFLLLVILLLEIPVFLFWDSFSEKAAGDTSVTEIVTSEPLLVDTALPTVSQNTVPTETAAQPTMETVDQTLPEETTDAAVTMDAVPQYFQNDYPDEPYLTGTVASSGSSMTALAMVASYLTDHAYYPDQMADYLAHFMGSNYQRLEYGNDLLRLSWKRAGNIHDAVNAVKAGSTVILMLNPDNYFTWKEHYLVLTGVSDDGKILVLDTDRDNYDKEWLSEGYGQGFEWDVFLRGYSCAWIYDKTAMEEPFLYRPEPPAEEPRYPELELTGEEKYLLARLICMEAGGEPFEGQQAVAEVILNRLASGDFQSSIHNIIHAPGQFAALPYLDEAKPDYTQYKAIEQAIYGPYVLPEDVVFFATYKVNDNYWGQIGSHYFCYSY